MQIYHLFCCCCHFSFFWHAEPLVRSQFPNQGLNLSYRWNRSHQGIPCLYFTCDENEACKCLKKKNLPIVMKIDLAEKNVQLILKTKL